MIAGLVLAAGGGRRLGGRPKALLRHGGRILLEHSVGTLAEAGCFPIYTVLGAADVPALENCVKVHNAQWRTGMGSSLRAGLAALPLDAAAVVVLLVDQPGITAAAVRRVIEAHTRGAVVAQATYGPSRGHPVLIDRSCFAGVAASAHGDTGARGFLAAHPELVTVVPCGDVADPRDIDEPADLARLAERDHP